MSSFKCVAGKQLNNGSQGKQDDVRQLFSCFTSLYHTYTENKSMRHSSLQEAIEETINAQMWDLITQEQAN